MTDLLVSVRSAAEAEAALAGGAALIDVKDPSQAALGRAAAAAIDAVVRTVGARRPVSAALGELSDGGPLPTCAGLRYVKWGLAGSAKLTWREQLLGLRNQAGPQVVVVAYADWQCASAPNVEEVVAFACQRPGNVLLLDTHCKDPAQFRLQRRPTLLDWLCTEELVAICERCRAAEVKVALAGSLGKAEIKALLPARPDWFAVRGAVCADHDRGGAVECAKVQELAAMLHDR